MPAVLVVAAIETATILWWIASFKDAIGTQHQHWYVVLPLAFLVLPIIASIVAAKEKKPSTERRSEMGCIAGLLLACNFIAFIIYAVLSGGGV